MKEVVVGIIERNGKFLTCQRKKTARYPLKWEFPGGKIEPGESPPEALKRELREELGVETEIGKEFFRQEWVYPDSGNDPAGDGMFRVYYFLISSIEGEPVNHVFEQMRWVPASDLLGMDILEGNREAVKKLADISGSHTTP
jgi:8-oxo-dGTP diphosphatase